MNAIKNKTYQEWCTKCQVLFTSEHRTPNMDKIQNLIDGFSVSFQTFHGEINECNLFVSENTLLDQAGKVIYKWRNLDTGGQFATMFLHSNGRRYLVFRVDLYGYGVLELESGKELNYIPAEAYPEDSEKFNETFIWTDVTYDPESDLLAVSGCYWACPNSAIIVDFSEPLSAQPADCWLDIRDIVDSEYTNYDHIDVLGWKNGVLSLCVDGHEVCLTGKDLKEKIIDLSSTTSAQAIIKNHGK